MNIELKPDECAVVIRADGGDIFVSDGSDPSAERSRYLLAIALHALRAEDDDDELWTLLKDRIEIRADEYEEAKKAPRIKVIHGGLSTHPGE